MKQKDFERTVEQALAELPQRVRSELRNIRIMIQDHPGSEADDIADKSSLFGLYVGEPLPEQSAVAPPVLPARIYIYREPLAGRCGDDAEWLMEEIQLTVLHEVGHHLGLSDDEMEFLEEE